MKDVIVVFSAINTGTHFTRMLLESHPEVGMCVNEDWRGRDGVDLNQSLLELIAGALNADQFSSRLRQVRELRFGEYRPSIAKQHRERGLLMPQKRAETRYYLFHAHASFATAQHALKLPFAALVCPVRHPFLSLCTMGRRIADSRVLRHVFTEFIFAAKCIWMSDRPVHLAVNPWQIHDPRQVLMKLSLDDCASTQQFIQRAPLVNATYARGSDHPQTAYRVENYGASPIFQRAKELFLTRGVVHPALHQFNEMLESSGLLRIYQQRCEKLGAEPFATL